MGGTVTKATALEGVHVGIIVRGQNNMNLPIWCLGASWCYDEDGMIWTTGSDPSIQSGLETITAGDRVTVVVNDGKLTFAVNGAAQGTPIELPAGTEVSMAVSLSLGNKVRLE